MFIVKPILSLISKVANPSCSVESWLQLCSWNKDQLKSFYQTAVDSYQFHFWLELISYLHRITLLRCGGIWLLCHFCLLFAYMQIADYAGLFKFWSLLHVVHMWNFLKEVWMRVSLPVYFVIKNLMDRDNVTFYTESAVNHDEVWVRFSSLVHFVISYIRDKQSVTIFRESAVNHDECRHTIVNYRDLCNWLPENYEFDTTIGTN